MALSVRMGAFLVDPLMGLPTCARRCFKVFFGHAVLPRKFCASKPAVRQARQSLWGLAQGNRTTMASVPLAVASRIHSERDVLKYSLPAMGRGGYARAHFVLQNLANIFDQAKSGTLIRRLSGGTSL